MSHLTPKRGLFPRISDAQIALGMLLVLFLVGAAAGYAGRMLQARDKLLVATAERYFAEKYYFDTKSDEIINAGIAGTTKESTHERTKKN